jgi:short-subunit dehydrogenase
VLSVLVMTQPVRPAMPARGSGNVVNASSGTTRRARPRVGGYAASNAASSLLADAIRQERAGEGIAVALVAPSITATEFAGGRFRRGDAAPPGMVARRAGYVGRIILRALRTGEARIDIPHDLSSPAG